MSAHRWRFLATEADDRSWHLAGDEVTHVTRVLRLGAGTEVEVTDGAGRWAVGRLRGPKGKLLIVDVETVQIEPPPPWRIAVAVGALRHGAVDELLPGLVELGVDRVAIFQQRGAAKSRLAEGAVERWHRIALSAMKQCKRANLPAIDVYESVQAMAAGFAPAGLRIVLSPGAAPDLYTLVDAAPGDVVVVAGGEKGLDADEEAQLLAAGFQPASLGTTVLRAVTAALAAASLAALRRNAPAC